MEHLIYSTQTSGFEIGAHYSNPEYWRGEIQTAKKVTVVGDWPHIVEAYGAAGVEVQTVDAVKPVTGGIGTDSGDHLSDEQLREAIEKATGKPAHPAMKRENLIAKFDKLNVQQD